MKMKRKKERKEACYKENILSVIHMSIFIDPVNPEAVGTISIKHKQNNNAHKFDHVSVSVF
jgi:hypothetical protein